VCDDGQPGPLSLANPEVFDADGEQVAAEGCLSIPGPY